MDISLEKIDQVMERTKVSFSVAKEALEKNNGDIIEAIVYIEDNMEETIEEQEDKDREKVEDIFEKLKEIIKEGNINKVVVKKDDKVLLNIPVTFAAVGALLAIKPALIGLGVAVLSRCTIEIVRDDGKIVSIGYENSEEKEENDDESKEEGL